MDVSLFVQKDAEWIHSDEGLTLETSVLASNLLRWLIYLIDPVVDSLF